MSTLEELQTRHLPPNDSYRRRRSVMGINQTDRVIPITERMISSKQHLRTNEFWSFEKPYRSEKDTEKN